MPACRDRRQALSLIETLVVTAIIAALVGLTVPAVQRVRETASRSACANNLKQLGLATHAYHDIWRALPPGTSVAKFPQPYLNWHARLTPHIEQQPLWERIGRAYAVNPDFQQAPHTDRITVVPTFACPTDGNSVVLGPHFIACTTYMGIAGGDSICRDGCLFADSAVQLTDITDGTANTLLAGERPPSADGAYGWWYAGWGMQKDGAGEATLGVRELNRSDRPEERPCPHGPYSFTAGDPNGPCDLFHFWSWHPGGGHFLFADGAVRFLAYSSDPILPALASRAGGESVSAAD